ncbi:uncharacterized protein LOC124281665 isoform X1 [Haliotis rubra]|uniref:uncharacterized protein LOC124281665 isoform X1 n=1 Tax=Haliotis rubra TaxID=36100 RepID=UPI001EE4F6C0|nr:uncharacterized protein LOC124281665 isoform X1 [Haliotis rubra]
MAMNCNQFILFLLCVSSCISHSGLGHCQPSSQSSRAAQPTISTQTSHPKHTDMATNEAFFDQADADKSKSLTIQELKKRLPNSGIDDATIVNIFMDIDKDSDRRVTKAEFLTASSRLLQLRFYVSSEAKQQNAFKDNDRDDSGTLDASELKRALSSSGTKITDFTAEVFGSDMEENIDPAWFQHEMTEQSPKVTLSTGGMSM